MHGTHNAHATMFGLARHARVYERFATRVAGPMYRRIAADVAAAGLPAGARVLDVGTGPGRLPRLIVDACPDLVVEGVDLSPEMVAHAAATAAEAGYPTSHLRYSVADVTRLPHDDGSVDLVVSSISLHHWDDADGGLREVARVLKPGGQAWIYDVRRVLAGVERRSGDNVAIERRLAGASRLNPLARLVVGPLRPGTATM
jgi:ubiquinone/menaquinone biosynthesis C-methylase UbiE